MGKLIHLPDTDAFIPDDLVRHPDEVTVSPAHEELSGMEHGLRPARAIPYILHADPIIQNDGSFSIQFRNTGDVAAVFRVRSGDKGDVPKTCEVGPRKRVIESWSPSALGGPDYELYVYGPNGFYRGFKGGAGRHRARLVVRAIYDERVSSITLEVANRSLRVLKVNLSNRYTSHRTTLALSPGESRLKSWDLTRAIGRYDLTITVDSDGQFKYQFAGHLENGEDSTSEPLVGGLV